MWPWGHVAVGYLLYSEYAKRRHSRPPAGGPTLLVLFGTLLPEIVDKPPAWKFSVLPTGRTLAHSLLIEVPLLCVVQLFLRHQQRGEVALPLAVGWLCHLATDVPPAALLGKFTGATFFLWPLLPAPVTELEQSFQAHLLATNLSGFHLLKLPLVAIAGIRWDHDGRPGLRRDEG